MTRIAIVAVHGIGPAQRYALQDEVAEHLAGQLPGEWEKQPFYPPDNEGRDPSHQRSALRLTGAEGNEGCAATFDLYEAYWSPLDKNRTSVQGVIGWLLNTLFAPLNAITPLPAYGRKLAYDVSFALAAVALVVLLPFAIVLVSSLWYAEISEDAFAGKDIAIDQLLRTVAGHLHVLSYGLQPLMIVALVCGALGWYVLACVIASAFAARGQRHPPSSRYTVTWQQKMRVTSLLIGVALIALGWSGAWLSHVSVDYHWKPLLLLVVALLVRTAIALAKGFFVNRLGDIQIYTTADSNSEHFDLHDRILWVVEETLRDVLATTEGGRPYYDRVHILAHSLGSTIAMDALIRIRHSVEAGTLESGTWNRIKSLVTFGTALEKTRFFFSVRNATLSQSFEQWRDDIYGRLFTCDPSVLTSRGKRGPSAPHRIFWANYWYFRDIVANEICTYRATEPGETNAREAICYNVRLRERGRSVLSRPWVHSDYLGDKGFWSGVNYAGKQQVGATEIVMAGCQLRPAGRVREPAVRPRTRVAGTQRG